MDALERAEELLEVLEREKEYHTDNEITGMLRVIEVMAAVGKVQQLRRHVNIMESKRRTPVDTVAVLGILRQMNNISAPSLMRQERDDLLIRAIAETRNYGALNPSYVEKLEKMFLEMER